MISPKPRFSVCHPEALVDLFASAGLRGVEITAIDIVTLFKDFEDYGRPFLGRSRTAPAHAMALDQTTRARLRDRIRSRIPLQKDGSICLAARAWAVRAMVVDGNASKDPEIDYRSSVRTIRVPSANVFAADRS